MRICSTAVRSPLTAASAARCETLATLEVRCDWKFVAALMTSLGAIIQPTRHPVMAYVFATPLTRIVWPATSGTASTIETARAPSYVRFW